MQNFLLQLLYISKHFGTCSYLESASGVGKIAHCSGEAV